MDHSRHYTLQLSDSCSQSCSSCSGLGAKASFKRPLSAVSKSLKKAVSGEYKYIQLPCNSLEYPDLQDVIDEIERLGLQPIFRVTPSASRISQLKSFRVNKRVFNLVLNSDQNFDPHWIGEWLKAHNNSFATLVFDSKFLKAHYESIVQIFTEFPQRIDAYFPLKTGSDSRWLSCRAIYRLLKDFSKRNISVRPARGVDVYDPRIPLDMELEPIYESVLESAIPFSQHQVIDASFVIPAYQNGNYIGRTLEHLLAQEYPRERFEVIVVDDGSTDNTLAVVQSLIHQYQGQVNMTYVRCPRYRPREMGDGRFRAGVIRNLGVKKARGEHLCFLDGDILVAPNYISQVLAELKQADLVQARRYDLDERSTVAKTPADEVNLSTDIIYAGRGYWHDFYAKGSDWNQWDWGWKYVCTYALSMKASDFKRLGWFRKNFSYYGFEDTDLGFRFKKAGMRYKLSDAKVFHQYHLNVRSEYHNTRSKRQRLLSKTAKVFYHNNLDPQIYEELCGFMRGSY